MYSMLLLLKYPYQKTIKYSYMLLLQ